MKSVSFKPDGRKITEIAWAAPTVVRDPADKNGILGPTATVVVRLMDGLKFNGRVDHTTVYAEGDGLKEVRDACFAQLEALHAVVWKEWHYLRFSPESVFSSREGGFSVTRVRTATTPHGAVWQRWGTSHLYDKSGKSAWRETLLGAPRVGFVEASGHDQPFVGVLCELDAGIEAAVAEANRAVKQTMTAFGNRFTALFGRGVAGVAEFVRDQKTIVATVLSESAGPNALEGMG